MQLNFTAETPADERVEQLAQLRKCYVLFVVRCGGCQIIHYGTLTDINKDGTIVAFNCWSEKFRNEYTDKNFTQHERNYNQRGELIKSEHKWQYVPIQLIERVVCIIPNNSR